MSFYPLIKNLLFRFDPETAHVLVKKAGQWAPSFLMGLGQGFRAASLKCELAGIPLSSPIGLAAGFDKNAEMLPWLQKLGFGFIEVGSVTSASCPGNDKPRIFRLPGDESLINRMGLPNEGCAKVAKRLKNIKRTLPIGVNLAKTPVINGQHFFKGSGIEDFLTSFTQLASLSDFIVLNLSCPNTLDGKTFEDPQLFSELALEIQKINPQRKPIFLKLSPDLPPKDLQKLCETALKHDFEGFVLTNTTRSREGLKSKNLDKIGTGGLSGKGLRELSNLTLRRTREILGHSTTVIACGGLMDFEDLVEKLSLGADFFEVYTGFIYRGPYFVSDLNKRLAKLCNDLGVSSFSDLKGRKDILKALR